MLTKWINVKELVRLGLDENKSLGIMRLDYCSSRPNEVCNQWFPSSQMNQVLMEHPISIQQLQQELNELIFNQLDVFDKVRTKKRVFKWIVERLREDVSKSGKQIVRITHVNAVEGANELKALMEEACKDQVEVHVGNEIGPVMAIHFGRGGVGACWMPDQYNI